MPTDRRHRALAYFLIALVSAPVIALAQRGTNDPPETFTATAQAQATGKDAGASAGVTIYIQRYTLESDRNAITEALRVGGYPGFLPVFRRAPQVGYVEMTGKRFIARWARQQVGEKGARTISVVTDTPILFLGGAAADAKPRAGFEVAVIQLEVDSIGLGSGTMAAAARVRPGGATGVQIDDYAETPIKLVTVRKIIK